jgi:hypothetical protein
MTEGRTSQIWTASLLDLGVEPVVFFVDYFLSRFMWIIFCRSSCGLFLFEEFPMDNFFLNFRRDRFEFINDNLKNCFNIKAMTSLIQKKNTKVSKFLSHQLNCFQSSAIFAALVGRSIARSAAQCFVSYGARYIAPCVCAKPGCVQFGDAT